MQIKEFRFLSWNEPFIDKQFKNWSRCYEWGYVLNECKKINKPITIHNTCCGPSEIHKQFHDELIKVPDATVYNSDIFRTDTNKDFNNFFIYSIEHLNIIKYDMVLCISTLEELNKKEDSQIINKAFSSLYHQTGIEGRLIITCDYPMIQPELIESIIGEKIKDTPNRLTGMTSFYKQPEYKDLSIILLDIQK